MTANTDEFPIKNYPIHLIPTITSKKIDEVDLDHYLGVKVEANPEIPFKGEDGRVNVEHIAIERIPGFSSNKIPSSIKEDLYIKFTEEYKSVYNAEWNEGQFCNIPDASHYDIVSNRDVYYLSINLFHGFVEKYQKGGVKGDLFFKLEVVHKPLMANFWHFEFRVVDADDKEIKNIGSKWKELLCSSIRDRVHQYAEFEMRA